MNRRQLLSRAFKGQVRLLELQRQHNWDRHTFLTATGLLDDPYPFTLHLTAFMAVIEAQGTQEQIQKWIPRCETMEILGCYAQTEYVPISSLLTVDWATGQTSRASRQQLPTSPPLMNSKSTPQH